MELCATQNNSLASRQHGNCTVRCRIQDAADLQEEVVLVISLHCERERVQSSHYSRLFVRSFVPPLLLPFLAHHRYKSCLTPPSSSLVALLFEDLPDCWVRHVEQTPPTPLPRNARSRIPTTTPLANRSDNSPATDTIMALLPYSSSTLTAFVAVSLVLWYLISSIKAYWRLRHFKGPWTSGISRLWLLRANLGGRMNFEFTAVNDKYGTSIAALRLITNLDAWS